MVLAGASGNSDGAPLLTFVTAIRHPATTTDYADVEALYLRTLRSLAAQSDRRWAAVVVANRPVAAPVDLDVAFTSIVVGFPPVPRASVASEEHRHHFRRDKGAKLALALQVVKRGHVMCLDGDDFVHRRMTEFVSGHPDDRGWFVDRGLRYDAMSGLYRRQRHFCDFCGSSLVFRRNLFPDVTVPPRPTIDQVLTAYGEDRVLYELGSHRFQAGRLGLQPLPFTGAVYSVNTGQNDSGREGIIFGRPLAGGTRDAFGVTGIGVRQMTREVARTARRKVRTRLARGLSVGFGSRTSSTAR